MEIFGSKRTKIGCGNNFKWVFVGSPGEIK